MAAITDILAYILNRYPHAQEMSNARITKMVYLADWKHAIDSHRQISSINWVFNNYGPFVWDVKNALGYLFSFADFAPSRLHLFAIAGEWPTRCGFFRRKPACHDDDVVGSGVVGCASGNEVVRQPVVALTKVAWQFGTLASSVFGPKTGCGCEGAKFGIWHPEPMDEPAAGMALKWSEDESLVAGPAHWSGFELTGPSFAISSATSSAR